VRLKQEKHLDQDEIITIVLAHVGADVHPTARTVMMFLLPRVEGVRQPTHRTASGKRGEGDFITIN
jgi:hypothetical protein